MRRRTWWSRGGVPGTATDWSGRRTSGSPGSAGTIARARRARQAGSERGSASVELAVGAPAFGLLFALVLLAARVVLSEQAVETAAWDAARSASIARGGDLTARASEVAAASLANQELTCVGSDVVVDLSRYATEPGAPSAITVTVSCTVRLWDLPLGAPTTTVTSSATSPTDSWRSTP